MSLPDWTDDGYLPAGRHHTDMAELYDRMVVGAPNRLHRERLFGALATYMQLLQGLIPSGRAWIDGGFTTLKAAAPGDIDVVILPESWDDLGALTGKQQEQVYGLLTLQDVILGFPMLVALQRIQPVGGALDAFLCYPGHEQVWHDTWACVKGDDGQIVPGAVKGYVEVTW